MTAVKLTNRACPAHRASMDGGRRALTAAMVVLGTAMTGACVSVNAPNEPIVIELNINIKQEVIYRLAADAGNTIDENADIF